jgi:AcrR family transcriptional regulator
VAGVSIGSFYEYFPSKASLLRALIDTHIRDHLEILRDAIAANFDGKHNSLALAIARAGMEGYFRDEELNRILVAGLPRVSNWRTIEQTSIQRVELIGAALEDLVNDAVRRQHIACTADCIAEAMIHRALLFSGRSEEIDLERELASLLDSYFALAIPKLSRRRQPAKSAS